MCVCVCVQAGKLNGLQSRPSGHNINDLWQRTTLIWCHDTTLLNSRWYSFMCECFLNEHLQETGHMKSWVGQLGRKYLLLCWYILNGYQAGCSTVYSTLESCKSLSFGNHKLYILQPFICLWHLELTVSQTYSMNDLLMSLFLLVQSQWYVVYILSHSFSFGRHLPVQYSSQSTLFIHLLPNLLLLLNTLYSQVPQGTWEYMPKVAGGHAQYQPSSPLRLADITTLLLPGAFVTHNSFTH